MSFWNALFSKRTEEPRSTQPTGGVPHWVARVEEEPNDPVIRQRAAEVLFRGKDLKGAIDQWLAASDLYMSSEMPVKALAVLGQALRADPENPEVRSRIVRMGRHDRSDGTPPSVDDGPGTGLGAGRSSGSDYLGVSGGYRPVRVPLFSEFPPSALIDVVGQMSVHRFVAGEILLREGEIADALAVVIDGAVRVLGRKGGRKAVKIGKLRPGDFFGLGSILRGLASQATLFAENPGAILVWPRSALEALCRQRPDLREALEAFQVIGSQQESKTALTGRRNPRRA